MDPLIHMYRETLLENARSLPAAMADILLSINSTIFMSSSFYNGDYTATDKSVYQDARLNTNFSVLFFQIKL